MGMDLIPQNPESEGFHFNWTGWRVMGDLLDDAGADLTLMAGSNDGDVVDRDTALAWADALERVLDDLVVVVIADESYYGGERTHLRVLAAQVRNPTQTVDPLTAAMAGSGDYPHLADRVRKLRDTVPTTRDPDPDDIAWVTGFIAFLRASNGFSQW